MKNTLEFKQLITRNVQYIIPFFQRRYVWEEEDWEQLWEDLLELIENPRNHFFGTFTIMQTRYGPEDISKFKLVDGQQRLTTMFILLTLIKDKAKKIENTKLANDIYKKYLVNVDEEGDNFYKLMPKGLDKEDYKNLLTNSDNIIRPTEGKTIKAYNYFDKKMKENNIEDGEKLDRLKVIITNNLVINTQELDENDDPLQIFDSINGKRKNVTKPDLICNYLFEHISEEDQMDKYTELWEPLEQTFNEKDLEKYIWDYLIMYEGSEIRNEDRYSTLKKIVAKIPAIEVLKNIYDYSTYYMKLLYPDKNENEEIKKRLNRLNRTDITTYYPLLLKFYDYLEKGKIDSKGFINILNYIENYIIRLKICGTSTQSLRRIFTNFFSVLYSSGGNNVVEEFKRFLFNQKNYPKDEEFKIKFKEFSFPENSKISKLILESFEEDFGHPEMIPFDNLTIEHIIPDVMTSWWKEYLGSHWSNVHEKYHDNIGNLTLIAKKYNSEASNGDFQKKKEIYKKSHLELNKYFEKLIKWDNEEIENRTNTLAEKIIKIWPDLSLLGQTKEKSIGGLTKIIQSIKPPKKPENLPLSIEKPSEKIEVLEEFEIIEKKLERMIENSDKISGRGKIYLISNDIVIMSRYSKYHTRPFEHCWFGIDKDVCKNLVNKYNKFYVIFKCQNIGIFPIQGNLLIETFKDFKVNNNGVWSLHITEKEGKIFIEKRMDISEYKNRIDLLEK